MNIYIKLINLILKNLANLLLFYFKNFLVFCLKNLVFIEWLFCVTQFIKLILKYIFLVTVINYSTVLLNYYFGNVRTMWLNCALDHSLYVAELKSKCGPFCVRTFSFHSIFQSKEYAICFPLFLPLYFVYDHCSADILWMTK